MAISSTGIGSGLDVTSIISQLTALEKIPLTKLQTQATTIQSKVTTLGQIKSQVSTLSDAAFKLSLDSAWNGTTVNSSNSAAVSGTISGMAAATSFSVDVSQVAKAQSTASSAVPAGTAMGTGTLTIDLGTWDHGTTLTPLIPPVFGTPSSTVSITVGSGEDSLASIAQKINDTNSGVTATVLTDASGDRLLIRSKTTGEASGYRIQVSNDSEGTNTDSLGLSRLAFDPENGAFGMSANDFQYGQNTLAKVNGVSVSSSSNSLSGAIAGLTLQFNAVTTSAVNIQLAVDQSAINKNIQDLVTAYNTLNTTLTDATKYDSVTKTAGILQGDATIVGLKNALISLLGSSSYGSTFSRLSDAGLELQLGGGITVNNSKLTTALTDIDNLKKLFKADNGDASTNGFALKIKAFSTGLLATDGLVTSKSSALDAAVTRNTAEQDKVNAHVLLVGARLKKQYSALDAQMANLTALNTYITQQVAQWNKKTG